MKSLLTILLLFFDFAVFGQNILQYKPVLLLIESKQGNRPTELAIRSFMQDTQHMYLIVQPDSIITHIALAENYNCKPTNWSYLSQFWANKPYIKALKDA